MKSSLTLEEKFNLVIPKEFGRGVVNAYKAEKLALILKEESFFSGLTGKYMLKEIASPFTAVGVLRAIGLSGGTLNYKGYQELRSLEWLKRERHSQSILPTLKDLKKVANEVNAEADKIVSFQKNCGEDTDAIIFENEDLLWEILKVHGLT